MAPSSGRLLAQMMLGEQPFADPTPYRAVRSCSRKVAPGTNEAAYAGAPDAEGLSLHQWQVDIAMLPPATPNALKNFGILSAGFP
jgi:hypothetical protein